MKAGNYILQESDHFTDQSKSIHRQSDERISFNLNCGHFLIHLKDFNQYKQKTTHYKQSHDAKNISFYRKTIPCTATIII